MLSLESVGLGAGALGRLAKGDDEACFVPDAVLVGLGFGVSSFSPADAANGLDFPGGAACFSAVNGRRVTCGLVGEEMSPLPSGLGWG